MIALVALAQAGSLPLAFEAGISHDVNLPYEQVWGLAVDAHAGLPTLPWLAAGASVTFHARPGTGGEDDPGWSPLAKQLLLNNSVSPAISPPTSRAAAFVRAAPFRSTLGKDGMATGVRAGIGFVRTHDDLVALQQEGDAAAISTQKQVHLAPQLGWFGEAWRGHLGLAAHVDVLRYTEDFGGTPAEGGMAVVRTPMFFEFAFRLAL